MEPCQKFFLVVLVSLTLHTVQSSIMSTAKPRRVLFGKCEDVVGPKAVFMRCANGPGTGTCELIRGSTHTLRAVFIPEINSTNVESYVVWNSFVDVPLPGQEYDACKTSIPCPVRAGDVTRFTYHLPIDDFWPTDEFPVLWTLTDLDTDETLLCFKFLIRIR